VQTNKMTLLILLMFCSQLSYANEKPSLENSKPTISEDAKFVFTNVKSYKRDEYNHTDAKTGLQTVVVNRDFVGTIKVNKVIDFMKIEINLFDKDGVYIDKCSHQEHGLITPAKEKYFLVTCFHLTAEVESQYRSYKIDATSHNPIFPTPQSATPSTAMAPNPLSPIAVKEKTKPKFIVTNLKSYPSFKTEQDCSNVYRVFVGTVQVDRLVDYISLYADLYDKKGIFLYRCDTQIRDDITSKTRMNFSISCNSLPPEVDKRYHHFKIIAF
jgi:hypothetical protein